MNECMVVDINDILSVEDFSNVPKRNLMLARIYALVGCCMRSQKRLWGAFGEENTIRLFDKMDEFIHAANNLYVLFDMIDDKKTEVNKESLDLYAQMLGEFVRSRNIWIKAYDRGLINAKNEKRKPKCGQKPKGIVYGDFSC